MECIRDVGPHVVGQISLSEDFPDGHVLKRGNDLTAGEAASEFFLHVPVDDQRQIAGEEVSFDVVFQADVSWSCLELGLHDAEAFFDLPSLVIHPDDVFGGILQIVGNRIESIIHVFFRDSLCVQGALDDFRDLSIFGDGGLLDEPAEVLLVLLSSFGVAAVDGPLCPVDLALTDVALILLVLQGESDDQGLFEVASVYRTIPCNEIVREELKRHRKWHLKEMKENGYESDFIFTTKTGGLCDQRNISRACNRYYDRIGVEQKGFHTYRHTFGTNLCRNGIPIQTASVLLGHEDISVTAKYYVNVGLDQRQAAVDSLVKLPA